jgi:zinc transport system substrate-binding protein
MCAAVGLAVYFFAGHGHSGKSAHGGKLQVVATLFPLADWAREVGGDDITVHCLVDGTKNPHHFEATIKDATRVTHARALLAVGLGLDPWAQKLAANSGSDVKIFMAGDWIESKKMPDAREIGIHGKGVGEPDDDHGGTDPHFWLDPARAIIVVKHLGEEFGKLDPPHKDLYAQRAAAFVAKLEKANHEVETLATAMPASAELVTFHDAYGYLFARLNIKIAAVVQVSPGIEPSAKDVAEAVKLMSELKQKVVFREPGANKAALDTLAKELGARVELLDPMDTEFSEAGKTYVERLTYDLNVIAGAEGITLPRDLNTGVTTGTATATGAN